MEHIEEIARLRLMIKWEQDFVYSYRQGWNTGHFEYHDFTQDSKVAALIASIRFWKGLGE